MSASKFWMDWAWPDFAAADLGNTVAVLPVAAVEQHGPHLPVGVDTFIMEGYLRRVTETMPATLPVLFLPVQSIGKSNEHIEFPGTLTLSAETVIRAWTEMGESVHRAGIRKLLLLNSHGGNVTSLDIVARDLRARLGMLVATASWHRFGYPEAVAGPTEKQHGIHAGEVETSLMMAFRPELVRHDKLENFVPASVAIEQEFTWLRVTQPVGFGWMAQDNGSSGAMGDAASATPDKGRQAADYGAKAFVELILDMQHFDLARLPRGPLGQKPKSG